MTPARPDFVPDPASAGGTGFDRTGPAAQALADQVRVVLLFLRRNLWLIGGGALLAAVLALWYVLAVAPLYRSSVLLMVERPGASPAEQNRRRAADGSETYVDGQVFVIGSVDTLTEVIARQNLRADPEFQPRPPTVLGRLKRLVLGASTPPPGVDPLQQYALRRLKAAVDIRREGDSNVVRVSVTVNGALKAARIADEIAAVYIGNRLRTQAARASQVAGWLDGRVVKVQNQLAAAEDAVAAFRAENTLITGQGDVTLNDQQLLELNAELVRTRAALAEKRAVFARAQEVQQSGSDALALPQFEKSEIVIDLRRALLGLQRRENELLRQSGSGDRRLVLVRQQIAEIEGQLAAELDRIVRATGTEVATLEARETLLAANVQEAGGRSGSEGQTLVELRELERIADSYRTLYERYLANAGVAREEASFLIGGTEIVSAASLPQRPVFPPKKVILLLSLMFGAGLGALAAALNELREPGLLTAAQAEAALGRPVAALLPLLPRGATPIGAVRRDPGGAFAEAVNAARHAIAGGGDGRGRVLCVTSAIAGEGKTSLSVAFAQSAMRAGLKVLLIDADFRLAGTSRLFRIAADPGLADILRAGGRGLALSAHGEGGEIDVMSAGKAGPSSADLLGSPALTTLLQTARAAYDLVVIDGPPVANLADAGILAQASDRVVFVARWRSTPRDQIRAALRRLGAPGRTRLVLNAVNLDKVALYGEHYAYDAPPAPKAAAAAAAQPA